MDKVKWYWWVLVIIFAILGLATLIPANAGKPSLLGYYSHCSFTPVSTIICWAIAAILYWAGERKHKSIKWLGCPKG
ncbi:MAG: hypothetical protein QXM37_01920 [Candidatus Bathyarchaeia archaeon]